jgi:hypothetical protein
MTPIMILILFLNALRIQIITINYHTVFRPQSIDDYNDDDNDGTIGVKAITTSKNHPRVLIGIFTSDFHNNNYIYRNRFRLLLNKWNDTRICSLYDYQNEHKQRLRQGRIPVHSNIKKIKTHRTKSKCEFIYTFVIGANPDGPPILLSIENDIKYDTTTIEYSNSYISSWTVPRPIINATDDDIYTHNDITLLNIHENRNEGKSQSWIAYYTEHLIKYYDFDYVAKWDDDSLPIVSKYFDFADTNLVRAPFNSMMYIGGMNKKQLWNLTGRTDEERRKKEIFFENRYLSIHLYVSGQVYFIANDLAQYITNEAIIQATNCTYCEGVEDHDISTMAFYGSPTIKPIKFVFIGEHQKFWVHLNTTSNQ